MKKISEFKIDVYGKGVVNTIEDTLIDKGAASASSNFVTLLDRIELVGGRKLLGAEETSNTEVLGIGRITKVDGEEIIFRKIGTKLQYLNNTTLLWVDIKTDLIAGEKMYFANSSTPAGRQIWMCGQDGLFKIYPSSPLSYIDLTHTTKNYKGQILIDKSRMICWGMKEDPTGVRFSKVDKDSNYTLVTTEEITDNTTGKKHYTGVLAHTQCFGVVFKDGSAQTLTDDKNGLLGGSGTGTINYATGAYVLDFTSNTATPVIATYLWEDSLHNGLADFGYSSPRAAGEGNVQRMDSIGTKTLQVINFNNTYYTIQDRGCWQTTISTDDLTWSTILYRENIGSPSDRSGSVTANGIVFVDTYTKEKPELRILEFNQLGDKIIPTLLSDGFDMSKYTFDADTAMGKKGDWIFIACKKESSENNTILIYNLKQKSFDPVSYPVSCFSELNGKVIAGDSTSSNVYELFTGFDDLDYTIEGSWEGKKHNQGTDLLKKFKKFRIKGYLDKGQGFAIYMSYDNDTYSLIGTVVGTGPYIDYSKSTLVGEDEVGEGVVGLGDSSLANYFETEIKVKTPKYERVKTLIVPIGIGYMSILEQKFSDIRLKSSKIPKKYTGANPSSGLGGLQIGTSFEIN